MQRIINQSGITVIEVLATITIMSILAGVVYSVFINGLNYSSKAKETVTIQQEANYVLTVLKEQHEKKDSYKITVSGNKIIIDTIKKDKVSHQLQAEQIIIESESQIFSYEICEIDTATNSCKIAPIEIKNTNTDSFHAKITITNVESNEKYEVQTILSRL